MILYNSFALMLVQQCIIHMTTNMVNCVVWYNVFLTKLSVFAFLYVSEPKGEPLGLPYLNIRGILYDQKIDHVFSLFVSST